MEIQRLTRRMVGNNLNVESLRDEYSSNSNGYNISAGISFGSDSDYAGKTTAEQNNLNNTVGARTSSSIAGGNIGGGVNSSSTTSKQVVLTSITANNADITVGENTNLKGSLIAAGYYDENGNFVDNGNLNFTTNTLTFSNLNSSTYITNSSIGSGVSLNQNKEGQTLPNASNVTYNASSGISYSKDKTLSTIGSGNLTVNDTTTSDDITKLNRDTSKINKELYSGGVSSDVSAIIDTRMFTEDGREQIAKDYKDMDENMKTIADTLPDAYSDNALEAIAGKIWDGFTGITGGILPSNANSGGVLGEIPILTGDKDSVHKVFQIVSTNSPRYNEDKDSFIPIEDSIEYKQMSEYQQAKVAGLYVSREPVVIDQNTATYQNGGNGILNNEGLATFNVLEQAGLVGQYTNILMQDIPVEATIFYNPTRGIVADLLESAIDTTGVGTTGIAKQAGEFVVDVTTARGVDGSNFTSHSQFNIITYSGINWINSSEYIGDGFMPTTYFISETEVDINGNPKDGTPTFVSFGSPVNGEDMEDLISSKPSEGGLGYTYMGAFTHSGDYVGEGLGGNSGVNGQASFIDRANILNTLRLFMGSWSPHSSYDPYAYEELRDVVGYKP